MRSESSKFEIYSDEELMVLIQKGEVYAFDCLYYRYAKRLQHYFESMLNFQKDLAEDSLQDLFLKIVQQPQSFDSTRSFKTWIFSIAHNVCKNHYRHRQVVHEHEQTHNLKQEYYDSEFYSLAKKLDSVSFRHKLSEALDEMSIEKRETFILRFQEDRSIQEIATIMGCPEGSVKSRLHYSLRQLEEKLKVFKPIND